MQKGDETNLDSVSVCLHSLWILYQLI